MRMVCSIGSLPAAPDPSLSDSSVSSSRGALKNTRYRTPGAPQRGDERPSISVPTIEAVLASNNALQEQRSMPGHARILVARTSDLVAISCAWRSASQARSGKPQS